MSLFSYSHNEPYYEMLSLFENLLECNKADPNEQDDDGMTPLHHVVSELFESSWCVSDDDIKIIKLLLKYKANPNIQDRWGRTPIMCFEPDSIRYCNKYLIFDALKDITDMSLKDNDKYWRIKLEE